MASHTASAGGAGGSVPLPAVGGRAPDDYQGFGRVDLGAILPAAADAPPRAAALFVHDAATLAELETRNYTYEVSSSAFPLVAALAWFDPPADLLSAAQLLHDLDLELVSPDGAATYAGNAPAAGGARDAANTVERVVVDAPALGAWTVKVRAHHLSEAPSQAYSLVLHGAGVVTHEDVAAFADDVVLERVRNGTIALVADCAGSLAPETWVGDRFCDDRRRLWNATVIDLDCDAHVHDGGDCVNTFRPTAKATVPAIPVPSPAPSVTPQPSVTPIPTGDSDGDVFGVPLPLLLAGGVGLVVACCAIAACVMCARQTACHIMCAVVADAWRADM